MTTFHHATTSSPCDELDRSRGRVQLVNGDLFYSPNCGRDLKLPTQRLEVPPAVRAHIEPSIRNPHRDRIDEFHLPRWWTPTFGYLAFLPLEPVFAGVPFEILFNIPRYFDRVLNGFVMPSWVSLQWKREETQLKSTTQMLLEYFHAPRITWLTPTALGYVGAYAYIREFRADICRSRDWFALWMGGLSYAIAVATSVKGELPGYEHVPTWYRYLVGKGYKSAWLSGLMSSLVGTFDPSVPRAGIILDISKPQPDRYSVDWLCRYSVPVWYPWGAKERDAASRTPQIARLAPLPHQLQQIAEFRTKEPQIAPMEQSK